MRRHQGYGCFTGRLLLAAIRAQREATPRMRSSLDSIADTAGKTWDKNA